MLTIIWKNDTLVNILTNNGEDEVDYAREKNELFLMAQAYATLKSLANKLGSREAAYFKGITAAQYMAVLAVFHLPPEHTTVKNIAEKLGTTKQNADRLIAAAEKKGYITVSDARNDKRAVNIQMTDPGLRVMRENSEIGINFLAHVFSAFNEKELKKLWSLLKKLYSFDGIEQSGFEEDSSPRFGAVDKASEARVLEAFRKKRNR